MSGIESNADAVALRVEQVVPRGKRLAALLERVGAQLHRDLVNEKLSTGGILEPRTGNLKRAVFHRVEAVTDELQSVGLGADLGVAPYARIQESGGTIRPTRSAHLAIPLPAMQTAKGVARAGAAQVIGNPYAFGFDGTFTAKGVIFGKLPGQIVPLFALKDSVTLPARAPFRTTLANRREWIMEQLGTVVGPDAGGEGA